MRKKLSRKEMKKVHETIRGFIFVQALMQALLTYRTAILEKTGTVTDVADELFSAEDHLKIAIDKLLLAHKKCTVILQRYGLNINELEKQANENNGKPNIETERPGKETSDGRGLETDRDVPGYKESESRAGESGQKTTED